MFCLHVCPSCACLASSEDTGPLKQGLRTTVSVGSEPSLQPWREGERRLHSRIQGALLKMSTRFIALNLEEFQTEKRTSVTKRQMPEGNALMEGFTEPRHAGVLSKVAVHNLTGHWGLDGDWTLCQAHRHEKHLVRQRSRNVFAVLHKCPHLGRSNPA